tara:strand:- start:10258 stop:11091 length:834 start_codon:yes stop_codon:yes gene_type:complete
MVYFSLIKGIQYYNKNDVKVLIIEDFDVELQGLIRGNLSAIAFGAKQVEEDPDYSSYIYTLKEFEMVYRNKPRNTKKGMMGELLAHLIIPKYFTNLETSSPYLNTEERSIRKGFDIVYFNSTDNSVWYSEVKSGHQHKDKSIDQTNGQLLKNARNGLIEMFGSSYSNRWDNAITNSHAVLHDNKGKKIREILRKENPVKTSKDIGRCVILVSVLFHDVLSDVLDVDYLQERSTFLKEGDEFKETILLSFQKSSFEKIANFVEAEIALELSKYEEENQ